MAQEYSNFQIIVHFGISYLIICIPSTPTISQPSVGSLLLSMFDRHRVQDEFLETLRFLEIWLPLEVSSTQGNLKWRLLRSIRWILCSTSNNSSKRMTMVYWEVSETFEDFYRQNMYIETMFHQRTTSFKDPWGNTDRTIYRWRLAKLLTLLKKAIENQKNWNKLIANSTIQMTSRVSTLLIFESRSHFHKNL